MRIVHALGWYLPDHLGGTETYVASLAALQRRSGHHIAIAAPRAGPTAPEQYDIEGIPVFRYPVPANASRAEARGDARARGTDAWDSWIAREQPDVLHVHSIVTGLGVEEIEAARRHAAVVVYTNHLPSLGYVCQRGTLLRNGHSICDGVLRETTCAACVLDERGLGGLAGDLVARVPLPLSQLALKAPGRAGTALSMRAQIARARARQARLIAAADRIVVLNEAARRMLVDNGAAAERVVVNALGVATTSVAAKPGPDVRPTVAPVKLGYVGRFAALKGVLELAQAVRSLPRSLSFRLELRGPTRPGAPDDLHATVRARVGDDTRVEFAPPVRPDEVPQVLRDLDLLLCPSTSFENGPTVALEAMAMGTPVLASRAGGPAEFIRDGENGRLVTPGDVTDLAAALHHIVSEPLATIDKWRAAIGPVRTMNAVADDYERLYQRLLLERQAA